MTPPIVVQDVIDLTVDDVQVRYEPILTLLENELLFFNAAFFGLDPILSALILPLFYRRKLTC